MWLLPDKTTGETVLKTDLRTASYEDILELWANQHTDNGSNDGQYKIHNDGSLTYNALLDYFERLNANNGN